MTPHPDILDRLHAAKPPDAPRSGDDRLWGQITATPHDPRLDRQPRSPSSRRHALRLIPSVLAVALAVAVAVAALVVLRHGAHQPSHPASGNGTRGEIVDRNGVVLADTTRAATISITPTALPRSRAARVRVYDRLAHALGVKDASRRCALGGQRWLRAAPCPATSTSPQGRGSPFAVEPNVSDAVARRVAAEHLSGVVVSRRSVRSYPGHLAAQALGLATPTGAGLGRTGLEAAYDRYLRVGDTLDVSLDAKLERAGERALRTSIARNPTAVGGAFVAMDPTNGQVYAMGSSPRATQSAGPTGSVFTPITAVAALASGEWTTSRTFDDTGQFCVGTGAGEQCRHNSGNAVDGRLDLAGALRASSDDFFYNLGARLNVDPRRAPGGGPLDTWASALGIGRLTGIDLPGESRGTLPTPRWRQSRNALEAKCRCGIADGANRPWSIGDNESLAVGQGDVQATPLQVAVAYAALANGGTVVRPHLGVNVTTHDGTVVRAINPPARHLTIGSGDLAAIRLGLHEAAQSPGGTSDDVMGAFPMTVYGKAGTAQYTNQPDYAWYAAFVIDHTDKPIVVVVHLEKAGFGDVAAAPVARQILSQWFFGTPGRYVAGTSTAS